MATKNSKETINKTAIIYKGLEFDVEYDFNDGYFDTDLNEQFQAEVFISGVFSKGEEVIMTAHELADIEDLVKENHTEGNFE